MGQTTPLTLPILAGIAVFVQSTGRCCHFWQACWVTATGICQMLPTGGPCPARHADLLQRGFILKIYWTCYKHQLATCNALQRKGKALRVKTKWWGNALWGQQWACWSACCAWSEKQVGSLWRRDTSPIKQGNMQRHLCAPRAIPWHHGCQKISAITKMTSGINHKCLYPHKIVFMPCATPFSPGKSHVPMLKKMHVKDLWHCLDTTTQPAICSALGQGNSEGPTYSRFLPALHHLRCKANGDEQPGTPPRQAIKY